MVKKNESKNNQKPNNNEEVVDLTNKWKRALADYQNLERRIQIEKEDFVKFAAGNVLLKILPALDTLEKAQAHLRDQGLDLAVKQLIDALTSEGLRRIETVGRDFDPNCMECIGIVEGENGRVLEEARSGYILNDRVLRVAQVKVGKKEEIKETTN